MPPERSLPAAAGCAGSEKPERAPVQFRRRSRASRRSLAAEWGPAKANLIRQSASASHQSGRSLARSRVQPGPYADWGPGPPRSPADSGRPPMGIGSVTTLNRREVYELHGASTGLRRGERRAPRTFSTAWAAAISGFGLDLMPCGNSNEESQRDSGLQPRVARNELPWEGVHDSATPTGLRPDGRGVPQPRWGCRELRNAHLAARRAAGRITKRHWG